MIAVLKSYEKTVDISAVHFQRVSGRLFLGDNASSVLLTGDHTHDSVPSPPIVSSAQYVSAQYVSAQSGPTRCSTDCPALVWLRYLSVWSVTSQVRDAGGARGRTQAALPRRSPYD